MAWTSPRTWSSEVLASATLNTHLRDNLLHICTTDGRLSISSPSGPHAVGVAATDSNTQLTIGGTWTPVNTGIGFRVTTTINSIANNDVYGVQIAPTIVEASSGTHNVFAGTYLAMPTITAGAAAVNHAATLYITGVPSAGANNYLALLDAVGNDGNHVALADSTDVAHGITDAAPTFVYGTFSKASATAGGLAIRGLSEDVIGLDLKGNGTNENTDSTSAAQGAINVNASKKSGTGLTTYGSTANIFCVRNEGGGARWFVKGNGDVYRDGTDNTYFAAPSGERYDDPMLALCWEHVMNPHPGLAELQRDHGRYTKDDLIEAGLLGPEDPATGRHFYNESALTRLNAGAIWTTAIKVRDLEQRLAALEEQHG
jgi:hypothetical protein